jgi:chromosome segregation protein
MVGVLKSLDLRGPIAYFIDISIIIHGVREMFLVRLDIFGFKSFFTKLDMKFGSGITGIVGPNGCGKTNIVDAIRWVLGEQKPSLLRSEQMEDVIFNGTAQRKPLGMAEVSLTINNSQGNLPPEYTEVMITRRLFRSGESEYLLNKIPCRRKDIVEMFMDTGMGPHAYSVIELSMVESIISGNTEALRALFEEAAGIAKYKARRREALRKLEATKANLLRLGDIVEEVERQVRGLRRQAAKAQRHQRYLQELRELEVAVARREHRLREQEGERLRQMLEKAEKEAGQIYERLSAREAQAEKLRQQLLEKESSLASLHAQLTERGDRIHKLEEQILVGQERYEGLGQQSARIESEMELLHAKLTSFIQGRKDREKEAAEAAEEVKRAEKRCAQKEEGLASLDGELFRKRTAVEKVSRQISDLLQGKNDARGQVERSGAHRETRERREQRLTEEVEAASAERDRVARALREVENKLGGARRGGQRLEKELQEGLGNRGQLQASIRRLASEERGLEGQLEIKKNRLALLQDVLKSYEGYQQGVKSLLTDLKKLPGIRGTVANALEVDPKYVQAVEATLGEAAQYILVETTETAFKAMEHLRRQKAGRATFLVLDRVRQLGRASKPERTLSQKGALAWGPDVVTCDPKYRAAVDFLLEGVVIVDDLASITPGSPGAAKKSLTWVSLSGDVLETPALLRGGHLSEEIALLDRQRKIIQEREELDSLSDALEKKRAQRLQLEASERRCSQKVAELQSAHQAQIPEIAALEKEAEALRVQSQALSERRASLAEELKELSIQNKTQNKLLAQLTEELSDLENQLAEKRKHQQLLEEELGGLETRSKAALKEVHETRVQLVSLQGLCERLRLETERQREMEEDLKSTLESRQAEIKTIQEKRTGLAAEIATKNLEVARQKTQRAEMKASAEQLAEEESSLRKALKQLESEIKEIREARESSQNQVHQLQLQLTEIDAKQQAVVERIEEEYQVNLQEVRASEETEEFNLPEREERVRFLRERIRTMGPVNLAALEEYNTQKERYDFLTTQREDLLQAEQNLNQLIQKMNTRARRLFAGTFKKVNQNFQAIFRQMFDGGEANLILNSTGDPLQADIEIFACPGGKRLRHIAQLSGGEKALTAISLLFSLYQVKPSPFCVLDEVDAPLDDVNIGRYVEMLKNLSQKSQFIIITHNKITMSAADVLYGVTMEETGISKMVSVNLRQAERTTAS